MSGPKFGTAPNVYNPGEKDTEIIDVLKCAGFDANACMQCGVCTGSCLSGRWTAMRTRNIMYRAAAGDASILEDPDIWLCTTCYNCYDRCPRDLKVTDAIIELRNLATRRGYIHPRHRKTVDILHKSGHAVPINDKTKEIRKELGLEEIPLTIYTDKMEVQKLAKAVFQLPPEEEGGD